jgi:hypothetical protein
MDVRGVAHARQIYGEMPRTVHLAAAFVSNAAFLAEYRQLYLSIIPHLVAQRSGGLRSV